MIAPDVALDVVRRSPAAVARHDKHAWLDLFADDFAVEDPYGGRPVDDARALGRFWDTYIATRAISFEMDGPDIVVGDEVIRDVTIVIVDDAGVELRTPAHLRYTLVSGVRVPGLAHLAPAEPRIARLAAHWEVAPVLRQLAGVDRARLRSMGRTTMRMLRYQGLSGSLGFARALTSVGDRGKAAVTELVADAASGDESACSLLDAEVTEVHKLIAAGDTVSASATVNGAPAVLFAQFAGGKVTRVDVSGLP